MDFNKYFQLLEEEKTEEAHDYRVQETPDYVYKYVSLIDSNMDPKGSNEKKLFTLQGNAIWCAPPSDLNDPFEFKGLYLDYNRLEGIYPLQLLDDVQYMLESAFLLASFTRHMETNMPMWAHYANNHKGFCVKYAVKNKRRVFPVIYEPQRIPIAYIFQKAVKSIQIMNDKGNSRSDRLTASKEMDYFMSIMKENYFIKHESWKYEEEYRAIYPSPQQEKIAGQNVAVAELGLRVDSIYAGINCQYKDRIKEIAQGLGVPCYQCKLDDHHYSLFVE